MPKLQYNLRYASIIKCLRKDNATFEEIADFLERESDFQGYDFNISKRTFQRDLEDIRQFLHVDIQYDFSRKVYFINEDIREEENNRMLEAFDLFNTLNKSEGFSEYIHFEKRKPHGTEHFYGLLHAIKNRNYVQIKHQKFWDDEITQRKVKPLGLKESKGRWYLMAIDEKDPFIKTFGLDRIIDFTIMKQRFERMPSKDIYETFKHCFGVIQPRNDKPQKIVLSFTPEEGKYVASYPLHSSQNPLPGNNDETQFELYMHVTYDFVMELLSFGEEVKVISPLSLKKEVCDKLKNALKQYEE